MLIHFKVSNNEIRFTYHMWWFQGTYELTGLLVICMGWEGDVVNRALERKFLASHSHNIFRFWENMLKIENMQ